MPRIQNKKFPMNNLKNRGGKTEGKTHSHCMQQNSVPHCWKIISTKEWDQANPNTEPAFLFFKCSVTKLNFWKPYEIPKRVKTLKYSRKKEGVCFKTIYFYY